MTYTEFLEEINTMEMATRTTRITLKKTPVKPSNMSFATSVYHKFKKAINSNAVSPILGLSISLDRSAWPQNEKDNLQLYVFFPSNDTGSFTEHRGGTVIVPPPYRMLSSAALETRILHIITRTPYSGNTLINTKRYNTDLSIFSNRVISTMIDYILNNANTRINYTWVKPLQDMLIERELKHRRAMMKKKPKIFEGDGPEIGQQLPRYAASITMKTAPTYKKVAHRPQEDGFTFSERLELDRIHKKILAAETTSARLDALDEHRRYKNECYRLQKEANRREEEQQIRREAEEEAMNEAELANFVGVQHDDQPITQTYTTFVDLGDPIPPPQVAPDTITTAATFRDYDWEADYKRRHPDHQLNNIIETNPTPPQTQEVKEEGDTFKWAVLERKPQPAITDYEKLIRRYVLGIDATTAPATTTEVKLDAGSISWYEDKMNKQNWDGLE